MDRPPAGGGYLIRPILKYIAEKPRDIYSKNRRSRGTRRWRGGELLSAHLMYDAPEKWSTRNDEIANRRPWYF